MIPHTRVRQFIRKIGITVVMSLFLGGFILGQSPQHAAAQALPQGTKLIADDGQADDYFGGNIDISGNYAIIGAPGSDTFGQDAGTAYIFHFNGTDWIQQAKLLANDGQAGSAFGRDVSIAGDYALVGASGKAYLFKRAGVQWVQSSAVTHNNPNFGYSVALAGQYAIVGAPDLENGTPESGSAVLYERTGDTLVIRQELTVADLSGEIRLGASVAISDTHAVVGAPTGNSGTPGAAYIFTRNGDSWQNTQTVHPSTNSFANWYGIAIDMSNDLLIVGSQYHQHIAHVYKQHPDGSWKLDAELKPQDGQPTAEGPKGPVYGNLHFGLSVSISGQYALVGDPRAALTIPNQIYEGAAYLYNRVGENNWQQVATITEQVTDYFALSVALSETHIMVGAPYDFIPGAYISPGSVRSYPLSATASYTIQGTVLDANATGIEGVQLTGLPSNTITDAQGKYAVTVLEGWSGSVTPEKRGYQFSPATTTIPALTANKTLAFTATPLPQRTLTVSTDTTIGGGSVTVTGGVLEQGTVLNGDITLYDGEELSVDVTADAESSIKEVIVDGNVVFAGQPGSYSHTFTMAGGNHTIHATFWKTSIISGTLTASDPNDPGLENIDICMSPQAPPLPECVPNFVGSYSLEVPRGWSGTIKAVNDAYNFVPAAQHFTNVTEFMVTAADITATPQGPIAFPAKSYEQSELTLLKNPASGETRFIGAERGHSIANPAAGSAPEQAARGFVDAYKTVLGLEDQQEELQLMTLNTLDGDRSMVRFQQMSQGLPVFGAEMIVLLDANKNVLAVSNTLSPGIVADVNATISEQQALQAATEKAAERYLMNANQFAAVAATPKLWIYDAHALNWWDPSEPRLVWRMHVQSTEGEPREQLVLVDAKTGGIALDYSLRADIRNRQTYFIDAMLGIPVLQRTEGDGLTAPEPFVNLAHEYAGDTYDFYAREHGRDSIDNTGMPIITIVDSLIPVTAYWSPEDRYIVLGTQLVADDVLAHEYTHGVTQAESNLIYYGQSGAINEAFSDIWGEFVDQTNGKDQQAGTARWLLGEDTTFGVARNMQNPPQKGQPDRVSAYVCTDEDWGGVHINSGIINKAAYLMTDGGNFNSIAVQGLGYEKVVDLFYEAQTALLVSTSQLPDLYVALQQACNNLNYSAADCQQVKNALDAVELNQIPPCGNNPVQTYHIQAGSWPLGGGQVTPAGNVTVQKGESQTFTMTPDAGYVIADVIVDGVSQRTIETYTFTDVQRDHQLEARFIRKNHIIHATAGFGGEITPSGEFAVPQGGEQEFTITPLPGYTISNVLVDGISKGAVETYTFTNVSEAHSIEAVFISTVIPPEPTVVPPEPTMPPDVPAAVPEPGTFLLLGGGLLGLLAATRRMKRK